MFLRTARRFATATQPLAEWFAKIPPSLHHDFALFTSLDRFAASLPVREINGVVYPLHNLHLFVCDEDLRVMVGEFARPGKARSSVKYLAAPTQYGKTSYPLHAFLKSALEEKQSFEYYIYLAFANNDDRHYKLFPSSPSSEPSIAYDQGADFILRCILDVLNDSSKDDVRQIPRQDDPNSARTTKKALAQLFAKFNGRVLIHLDEHRQMCDRTQDNEAGKWFSRGALSALAQTPGVTVLATHTNAPQLSPQGSAQTCRDPVSVPALDIDSAMAAIPVLAKFQETVMRAKLDREGERLWASLRFRLAIKLRALPLSQVHVNGDIFQDFLAKFEIEASKKRTDLKQALIGCCTVCKCDIKLSTGNENAAKLLVGVSDVANEEFHRQVTGLVLYNGLVTCDFKQLLEMTDPNVPVYAIGRSLMVDAVHATNASDLTAHRPLEVAYFWALSTIAARESYLDFTSKSGHQFKCTTMKPGRIFPRQDSQDFDGHWISELEPGTFYYADEGKGKDSHPLFDCWFRNDKGGAVLVGVTGGKWDLVLEKAQKLHEWIEKVQAKTDSVISGVVLAPNVEGESETFVAKGQQPSSVVIVRGSRAIELLGGLGQVFRWM